MKKLHAFLIILVSIFVLNLVSCDGNNGGVIIDGDGNLKIKIVNNTTKTVNRITIKEDRTSTDPDTGPYLYNSTITLAPGITEDVDLTGLTIIGGKYEFKIWTFFTDGTSKVLIYEFPGIITSFRYPCDVEV